MKIYKLLFLLAFIISNLGIAQSYRFVYEYKMIPDLSKKDSIVTNFMNLDSNSKESNFYNATKFEIDSIYKSTNNLSQISKMKGYDQNLNYEIYKNFESNSMLFYTKFSNVNIEIIENDNPKWEIQNDIKIIGKWNCQKAVSNYKGRNWVAWFSMDIPISDGPYKFMGLPGLIIEIHDDENNHSFNLIQIKKISIPNINRYKSIKRMNKMQYDKLLENHVVSSADVSFVNVSPLDNKMTYFMKDGNYMNFDTSLFRSYANDPKKLSKMIYRMIRVTNNPIELSK